MSTPDVSTAVDAALVILSRLAGGPVEVGAAAVRWAANRLDFTTCEPGRVELTFAVSEDEVIYVQDATASAALHLLTTVLRTQARVDAVNARLRAIEVVDVGRRIDPEGDCETALAEVTDNPCDKNGTRDGFVCLNCGRWSERIADIPHRFATCVPYVGPVRRGRR